MDQSQANQAKWKRRADHASGARPFRKYRNDTQPLTEDQRELACRYLPLARKLAKPLKSMFIQWKDEFDSAACLALVEAARSYDPSRNIRFAPDVVTLTPFNEEHGSVLVAVVPPPVGTETDDIDSIEHVLRKLPERHATVCRLHYLYGKTQAEIGEALGCSQSEITRLHRKSLELLSDPYDAEGRANKPARRFRRPRGEAAGGPGSSGAASAVAYAPTRAG